ncbi:MAG TPA: hypothetical protein VEY91_12020 [Candidatus Limnocylindria bacterium]|nr:hypothetical protein [Candidatus Limnocylindria bacterium]
MARPRKQASPPPRPEPETRARWDGVTLAALIATCIAGAFVFRSALGYFFAQDDFAGLARAAGVLPRLTGPWRFLSGQTYFDLMRALAGLDPRPYHAASLLAHVGCGALLFVLLSARLPTAAAFVGAVFFAVHPALFTALYSVSGIGEILALLFGLGALLAATARGRRRWLAVPLFASSLLAKESTLLLPLAVPLLPSRKQSARPFLDPVFGSLAALSIMYLAYFLVSDAFGVRSTLPESAPYALGVGDHVLWNFLSYLGWTCNITILTVRSFTDAVDPSVHPYAFGALVIWIAAAFSARLRARGWLYGGALYAILLLPVLPLRNHTYHYYLYAPLAGAAWCVAALFSTAVSAAKPADGSRPARTAWMGAVLVATLLTVNGALLVRKIETQPFVHPEMRADPTIDRARIAQRVTGALRDSPVPGGTALWFWSPQMPGDRRAGYWKQNVRDALMDGLAVRVLFPNVRAVEFVDEFRPVPPGDRYAVYARDGHLRLATSAELESLVRVHPIQP